MAENLYGNYQTPSSRPPEPPYRSNVQPQQGFGVQQPYYQPDTSGIDRTGEVPATGAYAPLGSQDPTEGFADARFGDTASMPTAQQPARAAAPAASQQQAAQQTARQIAYQQQKGAKAKSGAGKTFLFGFLGALVACAVAFGGFLGWQSLSADQPPAGSGATATLLGSSDPSVIDAVEEGRSLSEAVAAKALPSVVAIYNYQEQSSYYGFGYGYGYGSGSDEGGLTATGMGSGVVISADGYIITNYHVVEDADALKVTVDGIERDADYVGGDSSSDIAVLKVEDTTGLVAADIGDSDSLVIGEWVMTIGAPLGLEQSVATGVVSATNRSTILDSSSSDAYGYYFGNSTPEYTYYPNMIQTDALINPGNSGGALVDADGKLIGINSMLSSYSGDYAGVGFAIPINYAIGIAEDIIAGKEPTHAILGVSISQVNGQVAQRYNLSATSGAYIAGITEGTGAAASGLEVGDIITAINGKAVTSTTDVTLDVRGYAVGDTVTVTVNRGGEELDFDVVLSSDDIISSSASDDQRQQSPYGDEGEGRGGEWSDGRSLDFDDMEDLQEFLRMLGF